MLEPPQLYAVAMESRTQPLLSEHWGCFFAGAASSTRSGVEPGLESKSVPVLANAVGPSHVSGRSELS